MDKFDSNYLLELARQRSAASRSELAAIISDLFSGEEHVLTERERILMYEIIHHVVRDAEMEIRKVISSRLADREDPPEDLINLLANDEIEVAYPILTESKVLRDQTLIEIVRNRTLEHQMAVAIRHTVSPEVSEALVKTGNETAIRTLLQNENADLSEATMEFLASFGRGRHRMVRRGEGQARFAHATPLFAQGPDGPGAAEVVQEGAVDGEEIGAAVECRNHVAVPDLVEQGFWRAHGSDNHANGTFSELFGHRAANPRM